MKSCYTCIDRLMLPDQWALHIKGNSLILRPLHGRILVPAPVRWKLRGGGGGLVTLLGATGRYGLMVLSTRPLHRPSDLKLVNLEQNCLGLRVEPSRQWND